jgi:NADP-dependent 3-hydroxy acid dehydrogenase YdfG
MTDTATNQLTGRVAIVTGASSGIGQAIAERLGSTGARVHLVGRSSTPMQESVATIEAAGGSAMSHELDVRDVGALQTLVADVAAAEGGLHVMVNNAGLGHPAPISEGDPDQWREMLEVNVLALAVGCQAAIAAMRSTGSQGHLINISSVAALRRESGMYGATKHAVNCINASLREELEDDAIRVTSIMPGVFATNFARNFDRSLVEGLAAAAGLDAVEFDDDGHLPRESIAQLQASMKQMIGDVDEIAKAVEYVVTQPIELTIEELVIRPQKSLPI